MKKVLIIILVVLLVILAAMGGYLWYLNSHIFVEDAVYAKRSEMLDLRGSDISEDHYLSVQQQLPNCEILWDVPFQGGTCSSDTVSLTVTSLTQADVAMVKYFPNLTRVDATGCTDYAVLETLRTQYPGVEVVYQVALGGISVDPDVTELTLEPGDVDFELMMQNLTHLPQVTSVLLSKTDLTVGEVDTLRTEYSGIQFDFTVEILGKEYTSDTTALDLSAMTSSDVETVSAALSKLAGLETVELMDASGVSSLTMEDVKALQAAAGEAVVHYTFDFFGVTISTTDTEVKLYNKKIGDENEAQVRLALDIMENCERFVLDTCRLSDEVLEQIREDYRGKVKVVWRVWFGDNGSSLTDVEVIRAVYGLMDDNSHNLIYCEDVRFMDLGHNEFLDAVDFVAGMPKLEAIIISGAPIKSLEPFANCPELKFLEAANCIYIPDLAPLANCTKLEMVNLSYAKVEDLSALDELNLTHMTFIHNKVSDEEEARFEELHPDCWTVWKNGDQPYGVGWRYDEDDSKLPWYQKLVDAFKYPNPNNNTGWYLD